MKLSQIACCGVDEELLELLEHSHAYQLTRFGDSGPESSGDVKLAYFLQSGPAPDLILIGYPGARGLAACDHLYSRPNAPPILWLCDRDEFRSEAKLMGVGFFHTGPPKYKGPVELLEAVQRTLQGGSPLYQSENLTDTIPSYEAILRRTIHEA